MDKITKADMAYIDEQGETWINAEAVAELWNKRADDEYKKQGLYKRWSARNRVKTKGDLRFLETAKGLLYSKRDAETIKLSPRSIPRQDITDRNRERGPFKKKTSISSIQEN